MQLETPTLPVHGQFRWLWLGDVFRATANVAALVWMSALVYDLTSSAFMLGAIHIIALIMALPVSMFAGVFADWFNRHRLLLIAYVGSAVTMLPLTFLVKFELIVVGHILLAAIVLSGFRALVFPARTAMIPSVIPERRLSSAVGLIAFGGGFGTLLGPFVAGLSVALIGYGFATLVVSALFLIAWIFTWRIHVVEQKRTYRKSLRSAIGALIDATKHAWQIVPIRWVVMMALAFHILVEASIRDQLPNLVKDNPDVSISDFGLIFLALAGGQIVGALVIAVANPTGGRGMLLAQVMGLSGALLIAFAVSIELTGLSSLSYVLAGLVAAGTSVFFVLQFSVLLFTTRDDMRGRIMAIMSPQWLFIAAVIGAGGLVLNGLGSLIGDAGPLILYGAASIAIAIHLIGFRPVIRTAT